MDNSRNRHEPKLQKQADPHRDVILGRLRFVRWLVEQGRLEHTAAGNSSGPYATPPGDHYAA